MTDSPPLVELVDVSHRYGATIALSNVRLEIAPGEIHGLVGENGSGKSTVVKILSGIVRPASGEVRVRGERVDLRSPARAQRSKIVTVFQETLIADECGALDNIFGGTDGLFRRGQSRVAERERAAAILERLGASPALLRLAPHDLSLADRQILTLVRALVRPWSLLILDEATSALDLATRDRLFEVLKSSVGEGRSVLFVSHRMDELAILIDRATVQRSGRTIGTIDREAATPARLLSMMSGREEGSVTATTTASRDRRHDDPVAMLDQLRLRSDSAPFDLTIQRGEILGVAGLDGHGGNALVEAISGVRAAPAGRVMVLSDGEWTKVTSHRQAAAHNIAYVPGKRQEEGIFRTLDVFDNLSIATLRRHARLGFFRRRTVLASVRAEIARLAVVPSDPGYPIAGLSGGNAQKVLIARWLASDPAVLVLNDPLRGVDLGVKHDFYELLREVSSTGMTVVMLSTEIEELLTVCDRIAVCRNFHVDSVLQGDSLTYESVLASMFGLAQQTPSARETSS
jgi:ribose transport system ATP-binding protein